jgi:hypothetical protein
MTKLLCCVLLAGCLASGTADAATLQRGSKTPAVHCSVDVERQGVIYLVGFSIRSTSNDVRAVGVWETRGRSHVRIRVRLHRGERHASKDQKFAFPHQPRLKLLRCRILAS